MSAQPARIVAADRVALPSDVEWPSMRFVTLLHCATKPLLILPRIPHAKIVTIHVGQGSSTATFTVHADFLTNCSSFFRSSFNGQFAEAKSSTMTYPETTPSAFGLFLDWAYRHQLTLRNTSISLIDYVDLWLLADKLNIPGLQASAIAAIERHATRERLQELDFEKIWDQTMDGYQLRETVLENIARHMPELPLTKRYPDEMLIELFKVLQKYRARAREPLKDGNDYKVLNGHLTGTHHVAGNEQDSALPEVDFICDASGFLK
jgi:hypothetical protein